MRNECRGFDLRTPQNFCSLITSFDQQLDSLHLYDRLQTPYAKGTRKAFITSATLTENLSIIDRLISVGDLVDQFHEYDIYMALNFYNKETSRSLCEPASFASIVDPDPDLIIEYLLSFKPYTRHEVFLHLLFEDN